MHANLENNSLSATSPAVLNPQRTSVSERARVTSQPLATTSATTAKPAAERNGNLELRQPRHHCNEDEATIFPYIPRKRQERSGLLIDYLYLPAAQEAGDQVDFLILGENRVGVLLADMTGKIPEESSPVLKTVLRSNSTGLSAAATLRYLDQCLSASCTSDFRLTAFYAIFDQNKRLLHFASAGHLPMLIYRPALGQIFLLNTSGAPLGRMSATVDEANGRFAPNLSTIESEKVALAQNDLLLLYSDGLLSLRNSAGEYFGRQRLIDFIMQHGELSPTEFLMELRSLLQRFAGDHITHDDITVIALKNILRDLDKQHPEAAGCELAAKFMTTSQEQAILQVLRENPQAGVEEIIAHLDEELSYTLTRERIEQYLKQNGRWLQPWPARPLKTAAAGSPAAAAQPPGTAAVERQQLQQELLAAFPLGKLLHKRYRFSSGTPEMAEVMHHYEQGDYPRALQALQTVQARIKDSATLRCFIGNLHLLAGARAAAQQEYLAALERDQRCVHALLALAYLALMEEDYSSAIESLATALRLDRNLADYHTFLQKLIGVVERREHRSEWLL
ncbi:MAG: serine/threonine-protein phosphatase [candidate division KSB1 bacterium]|nr:serine/threonine-protein phosphatase [candidate division KSB1 bacterium]MDZ7275340.1 serine/threonine-protein phosphatase [candidate division KSB1 bacterium]MDZ7410110.1 serine/threonine-protein phosphatase [candidate division KSB1 bacterium]